MTGIRAKIENPILVSSPVSKWWPSRWCMWLYRGCGSVKIDVRLLGSFLGILSTAVSIEGSLTMNLQDLLSHSRAIGEHARLTRRVGREPGDDGIASILPRRDTPKPSRESTGAP